MSAAISWIRQNAQALRRNKDYGFVHVAAHLFALASSLRVDWGNLRDWPKAASGLEELSSRLSRLAPTLDPPKLYMHLVNALLTVEGELRNKDLDAMPKSTRLSFGPELDEHLSGTVLHWLRPDSTFARERSHRYEAAEKDGRPPAPEPHPMAGLSRLAMFWEPGSHHPPVLPRSFLDSTAPLIKESGRDASEAGRFRVALCPLKKEIHPLFEVAPDGSHFQACRPTGLNDVDGLRDELSRLLEAAEEENVHLLVLPELTVCPESRQHVRDLLRSQKPRLPYGVVAGSFHVWTEAAHSSSSETLPFNEALLLGNTGQILLKHHKKKGFRVRREEVGKPFFPSPPSPANLPPEVFEGIVDGPRLEILETSLGRLALLICADAILAAPHHGYESLVQRLRPDLLFIISMSSETGKFEGFFQRMNDHWISTLFVNARCICELKPRQQILAGSDLDFFQAKGMPPTHWRWRLGQPAECRYHKPPEGRGGSRDWRDRTEPPEPLGAEEHPLLGLIVDLGIHLKRSRALWGNETGRKQEVPS
jgi:predicted amidohydrolase